MGIVKISDELHDQIREASVVMERSINAQAEFWIKIGRLSERYPHLTYTELLHRLLGHMQTRAESSEELFENSKENEQ